MWPTVAGNMGISTGRDSINQIKCTMFLLYAFNDAGVRDDKTNPAASLTMERNCMIFSRARLPATEPAFLPLAPEISKEHQLQH